MKFVRFMVVLLVAFLGTGGKSSMGNNRRFLKITKMEIVHTTNQNNRLNSQILSKLARRERIRLKRQFPYHLNNAAQGYEGNTLPMVGNGVNLRDNVNPIDPPQSDTPRHIYGDPTQGNYEANQEQQTAAQRQDHPMESAVGPFNRNIDRDTDNSTPQNTYEDASRGPSQDPSSQELPLRTEHQDSSLESTSGPFNRDSDNPTPQEIYGDASQGPSQDPATQEPRQRAEHQDSTVDSVSASRDGHTYSIPRHIYDESSQTNPGSNQDSRSSFHGPDSSSVNLEGPLHVNIVKKFYPVEIVHRVPKPIPVMETKVVPIPVHQKKYRYYPQPFAKPFSRIPDVHVSYVHMEKRASVLADPCQHGGIIVQSPGGYACLCRKAYKGKHCEEKDRCYPFPCKNDGDCIDHDTYYECKCNRKFKGINCEVEDKCYEHPCKNEGTCTQSPTRDIMCICAPGFKGRFCQDLDYCLPNPCRNGGICSEVNQEASCTCSSLFKGARCQVPKICSFNLCRNGGSCQENRPSNPCECAAGFTGNYCTENVCQPNPCKNGGVCYPLKGDYNATWYGACRCKDTFKGVSCQTANPCASNPSPCVHGVCYDAYANIDQVDLSDGLNCQCYERYFGTYCTDKKCDHCDTNANCPDGIKCTCNDDYQGDGHTCTKIPDTCVPNPCENDGVCYPDLNTFECKCLPGFKGKTCRDKNPCSSLADTCKNGGTCIEHANDYHCICPAQFKGKDCSYNSTNLCSSNPCFNGGTCKVSEDNKSWYCVCRSSNFKPPDCACVCAAHAYDRNERNLTCDNPEGICVCPRDFRLDENRDVCVEREKEIVGKTATSCDPNPCRNGGTCLVLSSSDWMCRCPEGWKGKLCDEKVSTTSTNVCEPNPCVNGGTCSLVDGGPLCTCPQGFSPPLCAHKLGKSPCLPNPCQHNGHCITVGDSYDCSCDLQFTGPNCQVDRCLKCDPANGLCNRGKCLCKPGYFGNGYQCVPKNKEHICAKCHPVYAVCMNNNCQCKPGFLGNGYQCTTDQSGAGTLNNPVPWF